MTSSRTVIIGSGLAAALVARELRRVDPARRLLMIDAGPELDSKPGQHLANTGDPTVRTAFQRHMRLAKQIAYVEESTSDRGVAESAWSTVDRGMVPAAFLGHDMREFPGAALSWNAGGMGVHWTAACPWPWGDEVPFAGPTWEADLELARSALSVSTQIFEANPFRSAIIAALRRAIPEGPEQRQAQAMPLAARRVDSGRVHRSGPVDIFPGLAGDHESVEVLHGHLAMRLVHRAGVVNGISLLRWADGAQLELSIDGPVIVATDALRGPQLLWASGMRMPALGVRLNEHATLDGSVILDDAQLGVDPDTQVHAVPDEPFVGAYWVPTGGATQPTQGQMMETVDADGTHRLGLSWYVGSEIREQNRLEFSETQVDAVGMPKICVKFDRSDADLESIEVARRTQQRAADALGEVDRPLGMLLPAGSSLHYTGTTRMGQVDDGTSVCDTSGRVWGVQNLFLTGNGVVPTALGCNSTLTGLALAVRTARAIAGGSPSEHWPRD